MLFPARDFLLEFKREGSFQSPLKMYFSPLNNGLLSVPGGTRRRSRFCCRRGETSAFRAGKFSSERALPCAGSFVAPHLVCLRLPYSKQNKTKRIKIVTAQKQS